MKAYTKPTLAKSAILSRVTAGGDVSGRNGDKPINQ